MRRLYLTMVLGVAAAIVVATIAHIWVVTTWLRPDLGDDAMALMRGSVVRAVRQVDRALDRSEDPDALATALKAPVRIAEDPRAATGAARDQGLWIEGASGRSLFITRRGPDTLRVHVEVGGGAWLVAGPLPDTWKFGAERLSVGLAIALIVAVMVSLLMTLPVARGLDRLRRAARGIFAGDLSARVAVTGGPTRELDLAFNAMAERNQQLVESQRHLLEAVSHELRTPATRIRFALEMIETARDEATRARRLASIDEDLTELDELVGELLTYLRVSGAPDDVDLEALDLAAELDRLIGQVAERRSDVTIETTGDAPGTEVFAERRTFRRALRNLLLNASRHARGRVILAVQAGEDDVTVAVSDDGPGVAPEDRARIFEPFTRVDASRSRDLGGVGLGLAIVRRIVEVHGGSVTLDACPTLGGARFVTTWRRARSK